MKPVDVIIAVFGLAAAVAIGAVLGGTIVWLVWPAAAKCFPGLVASGALAAKVEWGQAVALAWICGILFKSGPSKA